MDALPVIDVSALVETQVDDPVDDGVARALDEACREWGFFYITGHGVPEEHLAELDAAARRFFARPDADKARIAMEHGGRAWRGWFPLHGELTSGRPDHKEGLYFGAQLETTDARVRAGLPLHGPNLFPDDPPELAGLVLEHIDRMTRLGHALMRGLAAGLGLEPGWFDQHLTSDPVVLFRIFRYPPAAPDPEWGVAEHTDYGLLTILAQDGSGGLQVHGPGGWIDAPPLPGAFVCNLGDMLERITGGLYRSTPHRVRNDSGRERLSFPFFFDPGWDAEVRPVPLSAGQAAEGRARWDGQDVMAFEGTYGEYLLAKVAKVFPELSAAVDG